MPDYSIDFLLEFGEKNTELLDQLILDEFLIVKKKNIRKKPIKYKKNKNIEHDKDIKFLLNKLSSSNLDDIYKKCQCALNNEDDFKYFLNVIFECSISQPNYCNLYSKLLFKMNNEKIKKLLMDKCKEYYSKSEMTPIACDLAKLDYDKFCKENMEKQKLIGCFNFIAELYSINMIDNIVILNYINLLVNNIKTLEGEANNKYVECYSNLLKNTYKNLKKGLTSNEYNNIVDTLYNMSNNKDKFKPRYRFMLDDIYNLIK